jgi:hypothetical protein
MKLSNQPFLPPPRDPAAFRICERVARLICDYDLAPVGALCRSWMRNSACILPLLAVLLCACSGSGAKAQTPFKLSPQPAATNQISTNGAAATKEKGYVLGTNASLGTLYLKFPGKLEGPHRPRHGKDPGL